MSHFDSIDEKFQAKKIYTITPLIYRSFLRMFRDKNPIHVDERVAIKRGFEGPVMHGGILNGFISNFVGMEFPAQNSLLQAVEIQYKSPCYLHDKILLQSVVMDKIRSVGVLRMDLTLTNMTRNSIAAKAKIQVGLYE